MALAQLAALGLAGPLLRSDGGILVAGRAALLLHGVLLHLGLRGEPPSIVRASHQ